MGHISKLARVDDSQAGILAFNMNQFFVYATRIRRCSVLWTIDKRTIDMWLKCNTPQKIVEGEVHATPEGQIKALSVKCVKQLSSRVRSAGHSSRIKSLSAVRAYAVGKIGF